MFSIPHLCDRLRLNRQNNKEKVSKKATKEQEKMKKKTKGKETDTGAIGVICILEKKVQKGAKELE